MGKPVYITCINVDMEDMDSDDLHNCMLAGNRGFIHIAYVSDSYMLVADREVAEDAIDETSLEMMVEFFHNNSKVDALVLADGTKASLAH